MPLLSPLRAAAAEIDPFDRALVNLVVSRTHYDTAGVRAEVAGETILTSEGAYRRGIVTKIV